MYLPVAFNDRECQCRNTNDRSDCKNSMVFVGSVQDMIRHILSHTPLPPFIFHDVYKCILLDFVKFVSSFHSLYCDMALYFGLVQFIKFFILSVSTNVFRPPVMAESVLYSGCFREFLQFSMKSRDCHRSRKLCWRPICQWPCWNVSMLVLHQA